MGAKVLRGRGGVCGSGGGPSSWSQWVGSPGCEGRAGSGTAPTLAVAQ